MALKATIYKATLQIADMDRGLYADHSVTVARHPSENDERMMVRLLALALSVPANDERGTLEFAKDLWEPDEPALWQKDLTGALVQWIEMGQPDDKRLVRASGRSEQVACWAYAASNPIWWSGIATKLTRCNNLTVWSVPADQVQALTTLTQRSMQLQITVQDGTVWVNDGTHSVEVTPQKLMGPASS